MVAQRSQQVLPAAFPSDPQGPLRAAAVQPQNATKAVFFDLDETLICNGGLLKEPLKSPYILISTLHGDIITSEYIIDLLYECTDSVDTDWYIISKGNNIHKLQLLIDEGKRRGKFINPNGRVFGLEEPIDKANEIEDIMQDKNYQSGIFVDDNIKNCEAVAIVPNITKSIHVKKDWFKFIEHGDEEHPDSEGIIYRPENYDIYKVALESTEGPYVLSIKLISQHIKDEIMEYVGGVGRPGMPQAIIAQPPQPQGPASVAAPVAAAAVKLPYKEGYNVERLQTEIVTRNMQLSDSDKPSPVDKARIDSEINLLKARIAVLQAQGQPAAAYQPPPAAQGSYLPQAPVGMYDTELARLMGMGYNDRDANLVALTAANGNMLTAVDFLIEREGPAMAAPVAPFMGEGVFKATLLFKERGWKPKQTGIRQRCTVVILPNSFKLDTDLPDEDIENKNHKTHYDYNKYDNSYTVTELSTPDKDKEGTFGNKYRVQIEFKANGDNHTIVLGFDSNPDIVRFINELSTSSGYIGSKPVYGGGNKRRSKRKNNKRRSRKKNTTKRRISRRKNTTKKRYSRKK